jgi:hypothetical protein
MADEKRSGACDAGPEVKAVLWGRTENHNNDQALKRQTPQPRRTSWRDVLPVHPAANIFPTMPHDELITLGEDIKKNGLRHKVAVIEGPDDEPILIDGRNRLCAMELVGLEIVLEDVAMIACCRKHASGFDPYDYVISANIHRRHLSAEQRRELIAMVLKADPTKSNRQIAEKVKADHKTVGSVRDNLKATGEFPQLETTTGKDGKARKQPIKRAIQPKPIEPPDEEQDMDVESPQVIENTAMDTFGRHGAVASANRKIFKVSSFDPEAKARIRNAIDRLIAKWRSTQATLLPKAIGPIAKAIGPIDRCTMAVRATVLEIMRELRTDQHTELFIALRDELDDLEKVSERMRAGEAVRS